MAKAMGKQHTEILGELNFEMLMRYKDWQNQQFADKEWGARS